MLHLLTSLVYLQEEMSSSIQNVTTYWGDVMEISLPLQRLVFGAINHNLLKEMMLWQANRTELNTYKMNCGANTFAKTEDIFQGAQTNVHYCCLPLKPITAAMQTKRCCVCYLAILLQSFKSVIYTEKHICNLYTKYTSP